MIIDKRQAGLAVQDVGFSGYRIREHGPHLTDDFAQKLYDFKRCIRR